MPEACCADQGIPTLAAVLDEAELRRRLNGLAWDLGRVDSAQLRILKTHPGSRCTLEIRLLTASRWHALIGKVYAADRSDVYRAMLAIAGTGFGPGQEFSIPQPIAWVPELNLLLQEQVAGPTARDCFLEGDEPARAVAATRCARWLGRFHRQAPRQGPLADPAGLLLSLDKSSHSIGEHQAPRLFKGLEALAAHLAPVAPGAGHASYSPAQVVLAAGRTAVFDWDGYEVADPARDVARFRIALRRLAFARLGSMRALDCAAAAFLGTYLAHGRPEAASNLRFYEAAACLQLAKYYLVHPVANWQEKLQALLGEGHLILEGA